jgi:HK97 family phage major capsid protein
MLKFLRGQLDTLLEERKALTAEVDAIVAGAESESRSALTAEETAKLDERSASIKAKDDEIVAQRARIADAEEREARSNREAEVRAEQGQTGAGSESRAVVGKEPETYRKNGTHSYFRDLSMVGLGRGDVRSASERLQRNNTEVAVESRALSTTDGAGGDFVPPLWMVNEYVALARTARPTADRVRNETLPMGTDQINVPKILTGTAVAEQATQNTAVQNTDATTGTVAANVATIAGQQVIPVQLIEQSPINMDTILLADLALDYAAKVDLFVLNNNATNKKGLLQETGTSSVTYVDATPTVGELYSKLADAVQRVATLRFLPADTIVMHPRRWAWFLAAVDASQRPLILPSQNGSAFNALGQSAGVAGATGVVGNLMGLDVILDPQIPVTLGGGTEDAIIVMRASDSILWEGAPHAEAFRETKADQLSVLLRFYRYAAFTTARYAPSVSKITGTGLIAPTF